MLNYTLHQLQSILQAQLFGKEEEVISSVVIDSRSVSVVSDSLFFAIVGANHDGHRFIDELYAKGVKSFVVSRLENLPKKFPNANFLLVNNTLNALHILASFHRKLFNYNVIGITGSNGKTIVKEWLSQLLAADRKIVRSPKSFNSQVGVPLSVLQMDENFDLAIFEAGISMPNEMQKLESIISPEIGVFTNLGTAHQENFDDVQFKGKEKIQLFKKSKVLIYCKDSAIINSIAQGLQNLKLFTWSKNSGADVWVKEIKAESSKTIISFIYKGLSSRFRIPFTDDASVENAIHCVCVMLYLGVDVDSIAKRMELLQPVAMRLELKEGINGCTIINDSYNSDLGSLSIALDFLARQGQHNQRMLIISDILQSGRDPKTLYSDVAQLAESKGVEKLIGIGKDISRFAHLFKMQRVFYEDTQSFIDNFSRKSFTNIAILLKGSRNFEFEKISALLEQKTHRTVMEINLNAMVHNLNYFRSLLKPNVKVMAMVKAFSYGSGSHEIASLLQFHRIDSLGVAFADEGIALRDAGITLPIVVLNPAYGSYELMVEHNLEPEIFSFSSLDSFALTLKKMGVESYPVHVKIDSGMHRLGFMEHEIEELIARLEVNPSIKVGSILSHLVATDEAEHDGFTQQQIDLFDKLSKRISQAIGYSPTLHILNSAGILRFPNAQFDMVRLGIGLYGVSSVHQGKLQNVSTLKTFIAQLRHLPAGETVGYSRKGELNRSSSIATIPIGYADGLNRRFSNGNGKVLIKNQLAPIIGNVSMDTCMIDVTEIPSVEEGDEVTIFGDKPTLNDLSEALGTIPYEILTSISRRVKRVYVQE